MWQQTFEPNRTVTYRSGLILFNNILEDRHTHTQELNENEMLSNGDKFAKLMVYTALVVICFHKMLFEAISFCFSLCLHDRISDKRAPIVLTCKMLIAILYICNGFYSLLPSTAASIYVKLLSVYRNYLHGAFEMMCVCVCV